MKQLLFFSLCLGFYISVNAQNLVPNPSFEVYDTCPGSFSSLGYDVVKFAVGWSAYAGTPDYYNVNCGWYEINAATGSGYCGLYTLAYYSYNIREFVGRRLSQALVPGTKYYASLKVNLSSASEMATNNIGILFTNEAFYDTFTSIRNHAQVYSKYVISDTNKWIIVSGTFMADSAYKYIVIGNFFSDTLTDTVNFINPAGGAYYYIDDICVSQDSLGCDLNNTEGISNPPFSTLSIYPNPANDKIFISHVSNYTYSVINELGQTMKSGDTNGTESIDVSNIPEGFYILKINDGIKKIVKKELIIH